MLVLCDFDGTIVTPDVTNLLWDRYGLKNWRRKFLPPYRAGEKTTLELMDMGWREIALAEEELLDYARQHVTVRDGFDALTDVCAARGWPLHVVSCGLDWYIRAFLPDGIPFQSYIATLEGGWRVTLPGDCNLAAGADFKIHTLRGLEARHPGEPTVFIGDGHNDMPVARAVDRAFAVRGSTLARLCAAEGIACQEFDSFNEVVAVLKVPHA